MTCLEGGHGGCERASVCRTIGVWRELDGLISDYLDGVTLADLMVDARGDETVEPCAG